MLRKAWAPLGWAFTALLLMAAAPEKEGMPQLDFKSPLLLSQVVWGAIIFTLLYFALGRWALPKVGSVVEERRSRIGGDLDTARAAKSEADAAVAELHEATRRARRRRRPPSTPPPSRPGPKPPPATRR